MKQQEDPSDWRFQSLFSRTLLPCRFMRQMSGEAELFNAELFSTLLLLRSVTPFLVRKVTSTPYPDAREKYRDETPISIGMLLQKRALFLVESITYTTHLYHDMASICIAMALQKYEGQCVGTSPTIGKAFVVQCSWSIGSYAGRWIPQCRERRERERERETIDNRE